MFHNRTKILFSKNWRKRHPKTSLSIRRLVIGGVLVFLGILLWVLIWSPFLRVEQIVLAGDAGPDGDLILKQARENLSQEFLFIFPRDHILYLYFQKVPEPDFLFNFPRLASLQAHLSLPSTLVLAVSQRQPIALWCAGEGEAEKCFWIDQEGVIFADSLPVRGRAISLVIRNESSRVVTLGQQVLSPKIMQFLFELYSQFEKDNIGISEFLPGDTYYSGFKGVSPLDWELIFLPEGDARYLAQNIRLVLSERLQEKISALEYIDARLVSRIFYKLR